MPVIVALVALAVILPVVLTAVLRRAGRLGPANRVTLARAALAGAVATLTADSFTRSVPTVALVMLATVALILDAVDGPVARRTGTDSEFGARFDMEVDAFLILVLSVFVARSFGAWVLAIGGLRYVFVAVSWLLPWLRGALPARFSRKLVAVVQGVVLVVASAGVLPHGFAGGCVAAALAMLVWSFGRDAGWLWAQRVNVASGSPISTM